MPQTTVLESGVSGEIVEHMRARLRTEINERVMTSPIVVVILGGTNDIGMRHGVDITVRNILGMHEYLKSLRASKSVANTVAMTIPTFPNDRFREARLAVNAAIRSYAASSEGFTLLLDIEDLFVMQPCSRSAQDPKCAQNKIPFHPGNQQYWDRYSPLHFSGAGYDALGRIVHERLCEGKSYFVH